MTKQQTGPVPDSGRPAQPAQSGAAVSGRAELPPGSLRVSVLREADSDVVVLAGELDFATAPELRSTIDELLLTGHNHIVVDLDAVTFVDAAAIDAVITGTIAVALAGGTLRITHNPRLMRLLEYTHETHRVEIARALQGDRTEPRTPEAIRIDDADLPSLL